MHQAKFSNACNKKNSQKSEKKIKTLGFNKYVFTAAEGFSGGIWCLWDEGVAKIKVIEYQRQFIHFEVDNVTYGKWFLTVIYASPQMVSRRVLWENMFRICASMTEPWILGGDFNATLLSSERKSPALSALSFDREFVRWMEEMQLQDVGFVGHKFTWRRGVTEARLDRFVSNVQWCEQFLNARVFHLPSYKSDHCPILLKLDLNDSRVCKGRSGLLHHGSFMRISTILLSRIGMGGWIGNRILINSL